MDGELKAGYDLRFVSGWDRVSRTHGVVVAREGQRALPGGHRTERSRGTLLTERRAGTR